MQENHACYATKILMSASACWPYGGEIGNLFGTCFFQSCKSFIQTDCTCPLEWLGWFDLHFWIPNFQTHSRKSLVLLFLSLSIVVKFTVSWIGCVCLGLFIGQAATQSEPVKFTSLFNFPLIWVRYVWYCLVLFRYISLLQAPIFGEQSTFWCNNKHVCW